MLDWERQRKENNDALEAGARSFVNHIETIAKSSLENGGTVLTDDDKEALEYAIQRLRPPFDQLAKWFIESRKESSPEHVGFGYEQIWELMAAAFLAGRSGTVTSSARAYFTPEIIHDFEERRAAAARQALAAKSAPQKHATLAAVRIAIKETAAKPSGGEAFARLIQTDVQKRLGRRVSVWTIRETVRAILKEAPGKVGTP
jgi:hypothetical protein